MAKHNRPAMTEDEWFELQYENYLETQANAISCQEDKIERELGHMFACQTQVSQQNIKNRRIQNDTKNGKNYP